MTLTEVFCSSKLISGKLDNLIGQLIRLLIPSWSSLCRLGEGQLAATGKEQKHCALKISPLTTEIFKSSLNQELVFTWRFFVESVLSANQKRHELFSTCSKVMEKCQVL